MVQTPLGKSVQKESGAYSEGKDLQHGDLIIMTKDKTNVLTVLDYILCVVLAMAFTAAPYYINTGECHATFGYWVTAIGLFAVLAGATYLMRKALAEKAKSKKRNGVFLNCVGKAVNQKCSVLIICGVIFLCWMPVLVFLYPGTLINDTWQQFNQFVNFTTGTGDLWDHHPIFDTMVMGGFIIPLSQATGKWHVMIFLYVMVQAFFTSFAFAYTIIFAYKELELGAKGAAFMLVIYAILPLYPASVQTVSKDALFSWIFVLFSTRFLEIVHSNGECLSKKPFLLLFTADTVLCCLSKKVGMYVVLLSIIAVILFQKKNRLKLLVPVICSVLVMNVAIPVLQANFEISSGGKQEMFSLPFQMTARYATYYADDVTEEEREIIDRVLNYDDLAAVYDPTSADPVKGWQQKGTNQDYITYLIVWVKQGLRHPKVYADAFNCMLSGWFSWSEYAPLMNMDWRNQLNPEVTPEWVAIRGKSEITARGYEEAYGNLYDVPFLKIFFSYGLYASLIPAFVVATVCRKWKIKKCHYWLGAVPMIFSLGLGCWLAPVSWQIEGRRYLYPITYTIPLVLMWCVYIYKQNAGTNEEKKDS